MPLGKYNCDYCDKQFQDTPAARRRHLQGAQHLRAKAQWFHSVSFNNATDPSQAYTGPFAKGVCSRFVKTGFCQYGDNCKYFHPRNSSDNPAPQVAAPGGLEMTWDNLPPSLQPPPEGGYPPLPFVDWG